MEDLKQGVLNDMSFSEDILNAFINFNIGKIPKDSKVLLAVSGGIDSVFMLDLFIKSKEILTKNIYVATFNHKLREEADEEAEFVRKLSENFGIPFFAESGDVRNYAKEKKISIEESARILRYSFLEKIADELGVNFIATAHNLNDLTENVLLRLTKGTGPFGLTGMKQVNGRYLKPILFFKREDIELYIEENSLDYRIDKTNFDLHYQRNYIRHEVIPKLKEINPSFESSILRLSTAIWELDDFVNSKLKTDIKYLERGIIFKLFDDKFLNVEFVRRQSLKLFGRNVDFEKLERFKNTNKTSYKVTFWKNIGLEVSNGYCFMGRLDNKFFSYDIDLSVYGRYECIFEKPYFLILEVRGIINKQLVVRTWKEGDRLLNGKKVKELFLEKKVPTFLRKMLPLISDQNGKVIYVYGIFEEPKKLEQYGVSIVSKGGLSFES